MSPDAPSAAPVGGSGLLERIREETRKRRIRLTVMVEAHRRNIDGSMAEARLGPYQGVLAGFGRTLRLAPGGPPALVDGAAIVRELAHLHPRDELFFDRVHPTRTTSAALAEPLVAQVTPWLERKIAFGD